MLKVVIHLESYIQLGGSHNKEMKLWASHMVAALLEVLTYNNATVYV